jgi:hypothetical protein
MSLSKGYVDSVLTVKGRLALYVSCYRMLRS